MSSASSPNNKEKELSQYDLDAEKGLGRGKLEVKTDEYGDTLEVGKSELVPKEEVKQGLQQRHIQMIALAGTIGTGLFLGSGRALAQAGPLGLLLSYALVGSIVVGTVLSLAEMAALAPLSGSYVRYAGMFFDPALSFAAGWNVIYHEIVGIPSEITAASVLFQFWTDISPAVFISVMIVLLVITNAFTVRLYGEMEFIFAMLKIALIVGLIIFGIVIDLGGGPSHDRIGFRYWRNPGPMVSYLVPGATGRFVGFWNALSNSAYAFASSETVAMAAAETKNPRRNIPQACRKVFARVFLFYILAIFVVGLIVPSNSEALLSDSGTASESPFVVAANTAGVKVLPHIVNAIVITSAWSSANAGMLSGSRTLYGMGLEGRAPKIFTRVHRWGVPYVGIIFLICWTPLAYMTLGSSATQVFSWLQSLISSITLIVWMIILASYVRFYKGMKVQGIDRDTLPYKSPLQPYLSIFALSFCGLLLITGGFTTFIHGHWKLQTFFSAYFSIPLFALGYFSYKLIRKTKLVPYEEMQIKEFVDFHHNNPEPEEPRTPGVLGFIARLLWG